MERTSSSDAGSDAPGPLVPPTAVAVLQQRLALTDEELCAALDATPLTLISGELEHRPELPILLTLTEGIDETVLARWLRAPGPSGGAAPLEQLLRRDFAAFEDALEDLRERGLVIRAARRS